MSQGPRRLEYLSGPAAGPLVHRRTPAQRRSLAIARFVAWRMAAGGMIILFGAAVWFALSPLLAIFTPFVFVFLFPELAGMNTRVRRQRSSVVLSYLEQAVRLNLPLPRMLDAARRSEEGVVARRIERLRDLLADGLPLGAALPAAVPETSARVASLVDVAERVGDLPRTLDRVIAEERDAARDPEAYGFERWYPIMMALVTIFLVTLIMIFVVPKIEEIFKDFGLKLPPASRRLIDASRAAAGDDIPWVLIVVTAALVILLGGMFERVFTPPVDLPPSAPLDRIAWRIPVVHGILRDRGMADACHTIAAALRGGRPLAPAVAQAVTLRINAVLRERLGRWQFALESGQRADDAARAAQLPPMLCGMIGAGRGADLAAAFDFVGDYYAARFSRAREVIRAAAIPAIALVFGAIVLFIAAGMYLPLIQLMDHLNDTALAVHK